MYAFLFAVTTLTGVGSAMAEPTPEPTVMTSDPDVKNYNRIKEIGEGAFGKVWHCYDPAVGRDFALKQITLNQDIGDVRLLIEHSQLCNPNPKM